jgi:hypothetical protein
MNPKIDNNLLHIKDTLLHLESRYNGDNDTTFDGNYPVVTYADDVLINCILKQNETMRLLAEQLDRVRRIMGDL